MAKSYLFLLLFRESSTFAVKLIYLLIMSVVEEITRSADAVGISIEREKHRFTILNTDLSFPFLIMTVCTGGSARSLYDLQEYRHTKNNLAIIMPGHVIRPLECSDDYTYTRLAITRKMLDELRPLLFSHDYAKFHYHPSCQLTDIQVQRLLNIVEQLAVVASHTEFDMKHRNHILLSLLSVGYEYLNYYRRDIDRQWAGETHTALFAQFCDLVVANYREHKDTLYYARQMKYHPKYLSRVIQSVTHGISPKEWIEQYVVAQAKRLISTCPHLTLKKIASDLGFTEPTSFYRYFKRVTGMTAKKYRRQIPS